MKNNTIISITLAALAAVSVAHAAPVSVDSSAIGSENNNRFSLGFTVSSTTRPYEGIGSQVASLPYFSLNAGNFYISGLDIGYHLKKTEKYRIDVLAVPRFLGYKEKDSATLTGLADTNYSYHGGLSLKVPAASMLVGVQVLTDLLGESGGTEVIGSLSRTFEFNKLRLTPAFSLNWQDQTLVDHYYGISDNQISPNRVAYNPDASLNSALSLTVGYQVTASINLIGTARFERFGTEIEDSPIVDNNSTSSTSLGLIYSF